MSSFLFAQLYAQQACIRYWKEQNAILMLLVHTYRNNLRESGAYLDSETESIRRLTRMYHELYPERLQNAVLAQEWIHAHGTSAGIKSALQTMQHHLKQVENAFESVIRPTVLALEKPVLSILSSSWNDYAVAPRQSQPLNQPVNKNVNRVANQTRQALVPCSVHQTRQYHQPTRVSEPEEEENEWQLVTNVSRSHTRPRTIPAFVEYVPVGERQDDNTSSSSDNEDQEDASAVESDTASRRAQRQRRNRKKREKARQKRQQRAEQNRVVFTEHMRRFYAYLYFLCMDLHYFYMDTSNGVQAHVGTVMANLYFPHTHLSTFFRKLAKSGWIEAITFYLGNLFQAMNATSMFIEQHKTTKLKHNHVALAKLDSFRNTCSRSASTLHQLLPLAEKHTDTLFQLLLKLPDFTRRLMDEASIFGLGMDKCLILEANLDPLTVQKDTSHLPLKLLRCVGGVAVPDVCVDRLGGPKQPRNMVENCADCANVPFCNGRLLNMWMQDRGVCEILVKCLDPKREGQQVYRHLCREDE